MNNLGLRQAKKQIVDFINGLPYDIEVKRLLIQDIYVDACAEADRIISQEALEAQKKIKEAEDGAGMATTNNAGVEK